MKLMRVRQFDYHLPKALIAQAPARPRDSSRLFVYDKKKKTEQHDRFINLEKYLRPDDVMVFNDTKVFPARLWARRETGGRNEVFLLRPVYGNIWEVLIGGKVRQLGLRLFFSKELECRVAQRLDAGIWHVRFNTTPKQVVAIADKIGITPTPPYIKERALRSDYQTVYAKKTGAVAAPTAGFHFTKRLLRKLKKHGVQFEYITLHVGYGTFQPVKVSNITDHKIHSEYAEVNKSTAKRLIKAKKQGRRIVAVGTTTVRTLETIFPEVRSKPSLRSGAAAKRGLGSNPQGFKGWIDTFIYPGYKFKFVDAIITNFHLPQSTLLMLISAFVGRKKILELYAAAVKKKYRFYSFGDGMFLQ